MNTCAISWTKALYANDTNAWNAAQQKAALFDAKLVADALYTLICLGRKQIALPRPSRCAATARRGPSTSPSSASPT